MQSLTEIGKNEKSRVAGLGRKSFKGELSSY